jgi:Lantibiotic dehydratase, N terminus
MSSHIAESPGNHIAESPGSDHLAEIPGTGWHAWRWALLRSAGFPVAGLDRLSMPACAKAADALLDGADGGVAAEFEAAFADAVAGTGATLRAVAADPRFRQAVIWQNPGVLVALDGLLRAGERPPRNSRHRSREEIVAKYWQRYCAKNDTVGFFGPMCWVRIDPGAPPVTVSPGVAVDRDRQVFFERWALAAVAERLSADPRVRPSLPVAVSPQLLVGAAGLLHPQRGPVPLPPAELALVRLADAAPPAAALARAAVADPATGFRDEAEVYVRLGQLVERGLLTWEPDLPMNLGAEDALARLVAGIGDEAARAAATAGLDRLRAARDAVAAAVDPDALAAAMAALDAEFTALSGREPRHNAGQTQAGRTLCHLEASRDLELGIGGAVLERLAPLQPLLVSARWLTSELAAAYESWLAGQHREAAAEIGSEEVPFGLLWYAAFDAFVGAERPADPVITEFLRRWSEVLGLADAADMPRLELSTEALLSKVDAAFPAAAPGWATARIHSPDLHICAPSAEAAARGDFTIVLGELHMGLAAFDTHFFAVGHPAPGELIEAMRHDVPASRVALAVPHGWPRTTAREAEWLTGPADVQLGFTAAPGIDRARRLPLAAVTVVPDGGRLVARAADGRTWPLVEMFTGLLWMHAFDTWKLAGSGPHTPRVTVDGLVIARETWRTTARATGLVGVTGEQARYLAVRRWRAALGLPERVFIRLDTETKPCYLDLTSPLYARILATMLTTACRDGADPALAVAEMLPDSNQSWLPDRAGNHYTSELRIQLRDPIESPGLSRPRR